MGRLRNRLCVDTTSNLGDWETVFETEWGALAIMVIKSVGADHQLSWERLRRWPEREKECEPAKVAHYRAKRALVMKPDLTLIANVLQPCLFKQ